MCINSQRKIKSRRKYAYKILDKDNETPYTYQQLKEGVFNKPKYGTDTPFSIIHKELKQPGFVAYDYSHLGKFSVYLEKPERWMLLWNRVIWKVEIKYDELIVGSCFGFASALVDEIKLIKKVNPRKGSD